MTTACPLIERSDRVRPVALCQVDSGVEVSTELSGTPNSTDKQPDRTLDHLRRVYLAAAKLI